MKKRLVAIVFISVFLAGCAQGKWTRPGATVSDFEADKKQCIYEINLNSKDSGNPFIAVMLMKQCLEARGYTQSAS